MVSLTGATHSGQPLGFGRTPSEDLRPWFERFSVSQVILPEGASIACCMLNDHPVIRVLFGARWTAETADGIFNYYPDKGGQTLFFGAHSRRMPLIVHGSFQVITMNLAAGAASAMGGQPADTLTDRIVDYDEMVGHGRFSSRFPDNRSANEWIASAEAEVRNFLRKYASPPPDPLSYAFDTTCITDPDFTIADFAAGQNTTVRRVERVIRRDFGITPKHAQRRARALDMAALLLGVTREEDDAEMRLRYFDQSHLNREMRHFFDMTPGQMKNDPHPLLRITMEIRQLRRLEALAQSGLAPWRDPSAEPSD